MPGVTHLSDSAYSRGHYGLSPVGVKNKLNDSLALTQNCIVPPNLHQPRTAAPTLIVAQLEPRDHVHRLQLLKQQLARVRHLRARVAVVSCAC